MTNGLLYEGGCSTSTASIRKYQQSSVHFKGIDLLLEVLWIEVGGFERSVFVWIILRVRHSPPSSIIMYSCYNYYEFFMGKQW